MFGRNPTGTMKIKPLYCALTAALALLPALALANGVVKDIRIEGLQRTDPGTVFNYLPMRVGDAFDSNKARDAVKALFATGFFNDVRIEVDGDALVVTVEERPTIAQLDIQGANSISKDQIETALKSQGFAEGRVFQQDVLDNAINELKQQYFARGRYSVLVNAEIQKLERNRVGVRFDIKEGIVAKIRHLNLVGNKAFSSAELLDLLSLSDGDWMSWYTKSDQYSKQAVSADLEKLRSHYLNQGYMEFRIESTQVAVSEDRESVFLTINLHEGEKYTIGSIGVTGEVILAEQEIRRLISLKPGQVFSREQVSRSVAAITERLGEEGYALANVNPVPEIDREKRIVNFTFYVDQGRKTYVRRINVSGNYQTRDEVVRREMRQMEAATYDGKKIKRSRQRIDQLGYFNEVTLDTAAVADSVDQVDLNVSVTEKKTGSMNLGIGYGQVDGLILSASLSQNNFLGSGKNFGFQISHSKSSKNYSASVTNPYATPDGISFGYNAYLSKIDPSQLGTGRYSTTALGGGFQIGLPVSDDNKMSLGLNAEELKIITSTTYPPAMHVRNYINKFGSTNENYSISLGWSRDRRDSSVFPSSGYLTQLNSSINVPGATTQFYKLSVSNQAFMPLWGRWVGAWTIDASTVRAYSGSEVPFYRNLYAGGVGSVRGYESSSLGRKDENADPIGGDRRLVNNLELIAPFPGVKDDKSLRLGAFWDAGGIWSKGENLSADALRQSAGVALTWFAPIGPIKLSYAKPINKKEGDQIESFQFQLGYVF